MKRICVLFTALILCGHIEAAERVVCVNPPKGGAPQGAVLASTLQKGIDLAGKYRQKGDQVTLLIGEGTYRLTKTLEMTAAQLGAQGNQLVVRPMDGASVTFLGGMDVPLTLLEKAPASETRVRDEIRDKIYKIDLRKAGVKQIGDLRNVGAGRPSLPAWTEVFIDNEPRRICRWPNDTMELMGKVIDKGSIPRYGDFANKGGTFEYCGNRPSTWKSKPEWLSGYFAWGYADDMLKVAKMDTVAKTFTFAEAGMYGLISGEDYNRWFVMNMLEELDTPGEYYLDVPNQTVWVYLDKIPESIKVSLLAEPMLSIEGVENVEVRGISFECTRGAGIYMERTERTVVRGCRFRNIGTQAVLVGKGNAPFDYYGQQVGKEWPQVSGMLGSMPLVMWQHPSLDRQAGHNNGVVDCVIYNVGGGGINMGGGNRLTLEPGGNYVQNCSISHYNRIEKSSRPAIYICGVGNRISNCEIFDAPSTAIQFNGNDHLIEYCNIHNVCSEIDDLGAIYNGRDKTELGNKLMYNYVHHLSAKHRVAGFYHDDGACNMTVIGNILYKAGLHPVLVGGGSDHYYENNIFINCPYGLYIDDRMTHWGDNDDTNNTFKSRFAEVNASQPPYSTKYPFLLDYINNDYHNPVRNNFTRNLFYNVTTLVRAGERPYERAYYNMTNSWITWSGHGYPAPGFVDEANENWNLKPDAEVFKQIPGFKAIPFDKIGFTMPANTWKD